MLQFVLGRAGTGKTEWVWQAIRARAAAGKRSLLVVPEQFASTADLTGYQRLGDELHSYLKVCSFRTLTGMIEDKYGGGALRSISDAGRMVLMRRTLEKLEGQIVYFARSRHSAQFCADCADTLQQLKYCGVEPALLESAAAAAGRDRGRRLAELALIYRAYEQARDATGLEPVDRLSRAAARVQEEFFADTACFMDGFGEFTAPETALLQRMLAAAPAVTVTLTAPSLDAAVCDFTPFAPAAATGRHLMALAAGVGAECDAPVVLTAGRRYIGAGLAAVEQQLARQAAPLALPEGCTFAAAAGLPMDAVEGVLCHAAADSYAEACFAAARMVMLARQGVPWEQMVVVVRDTAAWLPALQYACRLYGIPLFTGSTVSAEYAPMSVFLRAALGLAKNGLTGDGVLALLKTGLAGASEDELSALENYAYTWRPKADDWRAPFTHNPTGEDPERMSEADRRLLELAEGLRGRIVPIIEHFRESRGSTGRQLSEALYRLLMAVGAEEVVTGWAAEEAGQGLGGFDSLRMWQTVVGFLDQMAELLGDEKIRPAEYDDLLCVLLRSAEIGQAPHIQDQVQLACADSMRLDGPAHVFVLGLAEGKFPAPIGDSPLLTNDDRAQLSELGAPLSGDFTSMVLREQMNLYRALTGASRSLTLSWSAAGGQPEPCAPVKLLVETLGLGSVCPTVLELAQTPAAALELLAAGYREDTAEMASLRSALEQLPEMASRLQALDTAAGRLQLGLRQPEGLRQLLGSTVLVRPSKMEIYYDCPFRYFMEDVLRVRTRTRAELGVTQSGTLVHWVMEHLLSDLEAFTAMEDTALEAQVRELIEEFVVQYMLPDMDSRKQRYILQRLADKALQLLLHIRDELAQGQFVPIALEQRIGGEGGVPALQLTGSHGQTVRVIGSVDRVDAMTADGHTYLRVVDYKTGSKSFSLDEVCSGLDTQMLLYLMALVQGGEGVLKAPGPYTPAGVLYQLSDPAPSAEHGAADFEVKGLLLDEEAVLTGSDRQLTGLYLPCKPNARNRAERLVSLATMQRIGRLMEQLVIGMADSLYEGGIEPVPLRRSGRTSCEYCAYRAVCRHRDGEGERQVEKDSWKQLLAPDEGEAARGEVE